MYCGSIILSVQFKGIKYFPSPQFICRTFPSFQTETLYPVNTDSLSARVTPACVFDLVSSSSSLCPSYSSSQFLKHATKSFPTAGPLHMPCLAPWLPV